MGRRRWRAELEFSEGDSNNGHTVEEREARTTLCVTTVQEEKLRMCSVDRDVGSEIAEQDRPDTKAGPCAPRV